MTSVFKAVNDLIDKYTTYKDDSIFKNYYNNVTLPKVNHYAIIFMLDASPQMAIMRNEMTADELAKTVSTDYTQMNAIKMQVDFYGSESATESAKFATLLQSPVATNYLQQFGYTVQLSDSPLQIANPQDRGNYIDRYVVRFSLFGNNSFNDLSEGFTEVDISAKFIGLPEPDNNITGIFGFGTNENDNQNFNNGYFGE